MKKLNLLFLSILPSLFSHIPNTYPYFLPNFYMGLIDANDKNTERARELNSLQNLELTHDVNSGLKIDLVNYHIYLSAEFITKYSATGDSQNHKYKSFKSYLDKLITKALSKKNLNIKDSQLNINNPDNTEYIAYIRYFLLSSLKQKYLILDSTTEKRIFNYYQQTICESIDWKNSFIPPFIRSEIENLKLIFLSGLTYDPKNKENKLFFSSDFITDLCENIKDFNAWFCYFLLISKTVRGKITPKSMAFNYFVEQQANLLQQILKHRALYLSFFKQEILTNQKNYRAYIYQLFQSSILKRSSDANPQIVGISEEYLMKIIAVYNIRPEQFFQILQEFQSAIIFDDHSDNLTLHPEFIKKYYRLPNIRNYISLLADQVRSILKAAKKEYSTSPEYQYFFEQEKIFMKLLRTQPTLLPSCIPQTPAERIAALRARFDQKAEGYNPNINYTPVNTTQPHTNLALSEYFLIATSDTVVKDIKISDNQIDLIEIVQPGKKDVMLGLSGLSPSQVQVLPGQRILASQITATSPIYEIISAETGDTGFDFSDLVIKYHFVIAKKV